MTGRHHRQPTPRRRLCNPARHAITRTRPAKATNTDDAIYACPRRRPLGGRT
jgi:hypothetical protein